MSHCGQELSVSRSLDGLGHNAIKASLAAVITALQGMWQRPLLRRRSDGATHAKVCCIQFSIGQLLRLWLGPLQGVMYNSPECHLLSCNP